MGGLNSHCWPLIVTILGTFIAIVHKQSVQYLIGMFKFEAATFAV